MHKAMLRVMVTLLMVVPFAWAAYFAVVYRCDLARDAHRWRDGAHPAWLTVFELAVDAGCVAIALILLPKVALLWRRAKPLTRGEWISVVVITALVAAAAWLAPLAMMDPKAHLIAALTHKPEQCVH